MEYRPRRSSKRWLEDAPEYILAVYDNSGKTYDRYTVLFGGSLLDPHLLQYRCVHALFMNDFPTHPCGFSIWNEHFAADRDCLGKHIRWLDLPENVRDHVIARATEGDVEAEAFREAGQDGVESFDKIMHGDFIWNG